MEPIRRIHSRTVVLPESDVDTDQIIPARFLTTTSRDGLGARLFNDWRFRSDGTVNPDFVLNRDESKGCEVLVAGHNFGCGSSREHAPWALLDYGIRAVISTEIADIFRSNSLKSGLLPIIVDHKTHAWLMSNPGADVDIDVLNATLAVGNGDTVEFPIDRFARYCLTEGVDQLGFLKKHEDAIGRFEETRPWTP
ncbi:MAG: 3-isopropylmalate dehydratase small subunit [Woeseia sp.]